jgi:hypothetical protein
VHMNSFLFTYPNNRDKKTKENKMKIEKQLIQELGQLTVLDHENKAIPLATLWENQKTVLIFVRHFG